MKEGSFLKVLVSNKLAAYHGYLPAAVILFAGLVLSLALFVVLSNLERSETETAFELAASERVAALKRELDTKIVVFESMLGLYNVLGTSTQQGLYEFTKPLVSHMRGVQALGWLPRVSDSQRAEFEASMRQRGFVDFRITELGPQGSLIRASQRDEYFPVADAWREEVDDASIGFDMASNPRRWEALQRAHDTGEISATARVVLINDLEGGVEGQFGFLLFLPVYRKGVPFDTVEEHRRNLQDTLVGVFRLPDLVEGALLGLQPKGIDLLISDLSAPEGERLLYFHSSRTRIEPVAEPVVDGPRRMQLISTYEIGGRRWEMLATPAPLFLSLQTTGQPLYGLIVGLLFTVVVVVYTAGSAHRTQVIAQVNKELSREIFEREQAEEKVLEYQKRLKSLVSELNRSEEAERRLLASELHDDIAQTVVVSKFKLGNLQPGLSTRAHSALVKEISELIQQAVDDLRSLTQELSPTVLYELGFESALEWLAENTQKKYGLACQIEQDQKPKSLDLDTSIVLYQSIRELLINAVRHGKASQVKITLCSEDSKIGIRIKDDGVGFDTTSSVFLLSEKGGFGLFNIRERVEALGGTVQVQSELECGTQVTLLVPLKQGEA